MKFIGFMIFLACTVQAQQKQLKEKELLELSLEDLLSVEVTSASNKIEQLSKAPATIIVITEEEINERGYFELYDVLNDLPGFDLSRAFGDDNYYAYVRGYRKTTSDQMLLMIDGIIMNHLYNNNMNGFGQYPLQNIKQIEVVYGPASAIYGPNAFTGVINLITKKDGISTVQASLGQNNTSIIDLHFSQKVDSLTINVSGRLYQSNGPDLAGRTPMLDENLFTNPYYWGDFAQTSFTGYQSPMASNFLNASIGFKGLTVGLINFFYESGLGSEFAGGTSLNASLWQFKENTVYARYEVETEQLTSKTLLKYRRSDIPGSSAFLWRWLAVDTVRLAPGGQLFPNGDVVTNNGTADSTYLVDTNYQYGEYWQSTNASFSFFQDFTYKVNDDLVLNFGLKYDRRVLNRDYVINSNEVAREYVYTIEDVNRNNPLNPAIISSFPFPDRPDDNTIDQHNHSQVDDKGIYVQAEYSPRSNVILTGGVRYDYNSIWKGVASPRVGIVTEPTPGLIVKAFFGTAFLEPSARILYGGWQGSLSNNELVPEKMRTFEVSTAYTKNHYSIGLNGFFNTAPDAIGQVDFPDVGKIPVNLGARRMVGIELNAKALLRNVGSALSKIRGDLYVSFVDSREDVIDTNNFPDPNFNLSDTTFNTVKEWIDFAKRYNEEKFEDTGNMAPVKVKLILTGLIYERLSISLQNRYISEIKTVKSNPLGTINAYFVSDAFIQYNDILVKGLSLGLKVYNLFNLDYSHPGYRAADAGETSVNNALLNTSWYNSRLPQPERTIIFSLRYQF